MLIRGAAWLFGDNINTDLMCPNVSLTAPADERKKFVFRANRPDWSDQVKAGDVIVAGTNFGTGSGRPGSRYLRELGIAAVVAESMNGLFFRNSVNYALPVMECPGIMAATSEGDILDIDLDSGAVVNTVTGYQLEGTPLPPFLRDIIASGGLLQSLLQQGLVEAPPTRGINAAGGLRTLPGSALGT
jgi:3-isopropylmalate/(R)-2-methylmalate dehydratase small subunit